jgi:hypothetical protein
MCVTAPNKEYKFHKDASYFRNTSLCGLKKKQAKTYKYFILAIDLHDLRENLAPLRFKKNKLRFANNLH